MNRRTFLSITVALLALAAGLAFAQTNITSNLNLGVLNKFWIGPRSTWTTGNAMTKVLSASGTVDFAATSVGTIESSGITVTGATAGDPCSVGVPAAAGALASAYTCYVSAADTVKIKFTPQSFQRGSCTTADAGTGIGTCTATVTASSICVCQNQTTRDVLAPICSVSSTTLTALASAESDVVNYFCNAPVDPASGTYYVRVISSQ